MPSFMPINSSIIPIFPSILLHKAITPVTDIATSAAAACNHQLLDLYYYLLSLEMPLMVIKMIVDAMIISTAEMINFPRVLAICQEIYLLSLAANSTITVIMIQPTNSRMRS